MRTIVIKYGGSVNAEDTFLLEEIAYYMKARMRIVIVHGGGPEISSFLFRIGHTSHFIDGQRVTDDTTLDIVEMVLAGRVGKRIVRSLGQYGVRAVGISGEDAGLVRAEPFGNDADLGFVGKVAGVDADLLNCLLDSGYVPVVAPLGVDATGQLRNINADFVAGAIAGALNADAFILATDVPGVKESPQSVRAIPRLSVPAALQMIQTGHATGGMIPKIQAVAEAVLAGAKEAWIVDGRRACIIESVVRQESIGTCIFASTEGETSDA